MPSAVNAKPFVSDVRTNEISLLDFASDDVIDKPLLTVVFTASIASSLSSTSTTLSAIVKSGLSSFLPNDFQISLNSEETVFPLYATPVNVIPFGANFEPVFVPDFGVSSDLNWTLPLKGSNVHKWVVAKISPSDPAGGVAL